MKTLLFSILLTAACGGPAVDSQPLKDPTPIIVDLTTSSRSGFTGWYVDPTFPDSVTFTRNCYPQCRYKCLCTRTTLTFTGCGPQLVNSGLSPSQPAVGIDYDGTPRICYQDPSGATVGCLSFVNCTVSGALLSAAFDVTSYDDVSKLFTVY